MDEFLVSLLTPASDFVTGVSSAEFEGIFGRAGNDTIYGFDPEIEYPDINIDFLLGDLFDNSAEEFEIIVGIAEGNNPFGILNVDIPSVGRDRFVIGDETQPYYTDTPGSLLSTNLLGANEFAVIYDFDPSQDIIQFHGKKDDYRLIEFNNLSVEGSSQPLTGEGIFFSNNGLLDLVAFIVSTPEEDFELKDKSFKFVGDKLKDKAEEKYIVQVGTDGIDISQDTAVDAFGNIYVVGSTSGSLGGPNAGSSDIWVAKYDSSGNQIFLRQYGSSSGDSATEVTTDADGNFYVTGSTSGSFVGPKQSSSDDAWVAKFDPDGNQIWGNQFNAGGQLGQATFSNSAFGLEVQGDSVYVSGLAINENTTKLNPQTGQPFLDFPAEDDSWVTRLNASDGVQQSITQIRDPQAPFPLSETPFFDESYDLAVDDAGNSYLVGWTQGLASESDPSRLLLKYDAWLAKVDPAGQVEWLQQFGSADQGLEFGWAVETDSQGNIYATGWTNGTLGTRSNDKSDSYDIWISKFTPDGTQLFTKQIGSEGDDGTFQSDMVIDAQDNVFLIGYTNDKLGKGKKDKDSLNAFVAKLDSNGNEQWVQQFGTKEQTEYATGIALDNNGDVIVTGFTEGSLGDGNGATTNGGAVDSWVARLGSEKGKLEEFIGDRESSFAASPANDIQVTDISDEFETDESLPEGDNQIITGLGAAGEDVVSSLSSAFNPSTFASELANDASLAADGTVIDLQNLEGNSDDDDDDDDDDDNSSSFDGGDLKGNDGDDVLFGGFGSNKIEGKEGNDTLSGGAGSDEIKGGKGLDVLIGVDESSSVAGSGEIDELKGEDDADLFVLGNASSVFYIGNGTGDYGFIEDFEFDEDDRIQLNGQPSDYFLGSDVDDAPDGLAIFQASSNDLIGIVKDVDDDLSLFDTSVFSYV